jgi:F0F1-type ATP synthase assembly protein I
MASRPNDTLRLAGQLSTVGLSFVFALVLGFGGGYLLDGWLGTRPWFSFLGFFLGVAAGILNVYRVLGAVNATGTGIGRREPFDSTGRTAGVAQDRSGVGNRESEDPGP